MTSKIETKICSFGDLLTGEQFFSVPPYQRDYSWTDAEVGQLWDDILLSIDEARDEYFLGAIVVNSSKGPMLEVIDGQQRIATVSILLCVIRDHFRAAGLQEEAGIIAEFLGKRDMATLKTIPKLTLNEINHGFYQDNIINQVELAHLLKSGKQKNEYKSNSLLAGAYAYLYKKLAEYIQSFSGVKQALVSVYNCIRSKLVAIQISVTDTADAYLIFETLNDRGLDLSVSDLLKNHLLSQAGGHIDTVKREWRDITNLIDHQGVSKFIRHYWLSTESLVREKDLYRTISKRVREPLAVAEYVKRLKSAAYFYSALADSGHVLWDDFPPSVRRSIATLKLFNVSQCYPLLLAVLESHKQYMLGEVLEMIQVISFRYNVIGGLTPRGLDAVYGEAARFVRANESKSPKAVFEVMERLYIKDDNFKVAFSEKQIKNPKIARYILARLSNKMGGSRELVANENEKEINLEHVMPLSLSPEWVAALGSDASKQATDYVHRIGNLTLVESSVNKKIGNISFDKKKEVCFGRSELPINEFISSSAQWGPKEIEDRQDSFSQLAVQIWRLDY